MATLSTVSVDFVANTAKYTQGLTGMQKQTKTWSTNINKDTQGATDAFDGASKALTRLAKQAISVVAIQKIGAAFVDAAQSASKLVDEAEKIGISAGDLAVLEMAAQKSGVSVDAIRTSFRELQKSVNEALNGVEGTAKAFIDLGISYTELSKKDPTSGFYDIVDALKAVKDANKKAELGTLLLGKAYQETTPLINKGSAGIQAAGAGALGAEQLGQIDKITKAFEQVGNILQNEIKKSLIEIAPLLINIAKAATYIIENFKGIASIIAIAFSPIALYKFATGLETLARIISYKLIAALQEVEYNAVLGGKSLKSMFSTETLKRFASINPLLLNTAGFLSNIAIIAGQTVFAIGALTAGFTAASYGFEAYAQKIGNSSAAADLRESRTALADLAIEVTRFFGLTFAGKTSTEKLADEAAYAGKKLAEAKKRFAEIAEAKKQTDIQLAKDKDLVNFRQTLDSIIKLPIVERYNKLIELQAKFNNTLDPKKQEELRKAMEGMDQELRNLNQSTIENIDAGAKRYRQQAEIDLLVREGLMTEAEAYYAKAKFARDEAGQYDEIIKLKQDVLNITKNSMIIDAEKSDRIRTLGQSYIDLIDPISKFERELKKVNAVEYLQIITPDERAALEDYYKLQLKSTQVGLTGSEKLSAEQKYLETLQQINQYLPQTSQNIEVITMRTVALKNAEMQRFTEITPYFREIAGFGQSFADGLANAIIEGQNFGDALKNVFQDILKQIAVLILRTTILQGIMAAIGIVNPVASAAFGKMAGLVPRASGGPVMAGGGYRVGEAGPETFVPATNGYILPNDMAPSETVVVNQTINVQTGVAQTVRAEMASLLPKFKSEAMAGVLEAKQRGGSYSRGLSFA